VPIDASLLGTWRCLAFEEHADAKPFNLAVARAGDRRYAVVFQQDGESPDQLDAYASMVKGQTLVNVHMPDEGTKPWIVARYSLQRPDLLYVEVMDDDKVGDADASPESFRRATEKAIKHADLFNAFSICVKARE
jgi:hypothetical protein